MAAWLRTADSDKAKLTREGQIADRGDEPAYPPVTVGHFLVECLKELNFCLDGAMGPTPLTPAELAGWARGTHTELGAYDFQDLLEASRVYVSCERRYSGNPEPAPWAPELSPEEQAKIDAAEEAAWDRAMGIG